MRIRSLSLAVLFSTLVFVGVAHADVYQLNIMNHQFTPMELVVPAHQDVRILVHNMDNAQVKLDAPDLGQHSVILSPMQTMEIDISPVEPGSYNLTDIASPNGATAIVTAK